jgi:serine/threonine-protein kinase
MTLQPGVRLGPYEITSLLGAGGMGEVFRAHDSKLRRDVALKILPAAFAADPERRARFTREAQVLAALNHPHIAAIYGLEEGDGVLALALELVEGEDLSQRMIRGAVHVEEATAIARQIAEGLEAAHEKSVVHRDLKPGNIKLTPDGAVKILDFGLAKAREGESAADGDVSHSPTLSRRMTEAGIILGTAAYMSPEQARGKNVDKRADIWSFGVVLFEMLSGRRLFTGETVSDVIAGVLTREPDWSALPPSVPPAVRRLLRLCLERDPKSRLRDIGDVRAYLDPNGLPGEAPPATQDSMSDRRWKLIAALAGLAAIAAVVTLLLRPGAPAARPGDERPFRFSFQLRGAQQIAIDMDQPLFDISPDGETLAWIGAAAPGGRQVFTRSVRDLAVRAVPNTLGAQNTGILRLSPDGRQVSFLRDDELWTAPLDGGAAPQRIYHGSRLWTWDWAGDGSFVLQEAYGALLRLKAPGARAEALTTLDSKSDEVFHGFPQVLPGRRSLLFSVGRGYFYTTRIDALRLDGGTPRRKVVLENGYLARYVATGHLVYGRGNTIYAAQFDPEALSITGPETTLVTDVQIDSVGPALTEFVVSQNGTLAYVPDQRLEEYRLGWADRRGGIAWLPTPGSLYADPFISPNGNSVAVSSRFKGDRSRQIYVVDLARPIPRQLTDTGWNYAPIWSAFGRDLVFSSTRDGHLNLYRAAVDNPAVVKRITTSTLDQFATSWSREGLLVLFERMFLDARRIVALSLAGTATGPLPVITPEKGSESDGALPPDGKWLAFTKSEGNSNQVYVRSLSPEGLAGAEQRVSTQGGWHPRWRPDGRELLYLSADYRRILSVKAELGSQLRLGEETVAFAAPEGLELKSFDVAADGRLLIVAREKPTAPMEVVVSLGALRGPAAK